MKSTKSPRLGLAHRSRSSRTTDTQDPQSTSTRMRRPSQSSNEHHEESAPVADSRGAEAGLSGISTSREDPTDMETMRRKMSEALALKQMRKLPSPHPSMQPAAPSDSVSKDLARVTTAQSHPSSQESLPSGTLSTDSAKTVRASFDVTSGAIRTPSYPFPRMQLKLNRGSSHRSAPSHKPFTLLSPTNTPVGDAQAPNNTEDLASSDVTTPMGHDRPPQGGTYEDPNFPTPDLYDTILVLNSEPGLEGWWANVSQVLAEEYGAERASLAVPGDMTDLENVPWGQKATFNIWGTDSFESNVESSTTSEPDSFAYAPAKPQASLTTTQAPQRPGLVSRHSIAGVFPGGASRPALQRPTAPVRAFSSLTGNREDQDSPAPVPRFIRQSFRLPSGTWSDSPVVKPLYESSASASSTLRCLVHRSIQPLESEEDALLVRTGVATLFGKRQPVVLTRAYNDVESLSDRSSRDWSRNLGAGTRTSSNGRSANEDSQRIFQLRAFDEYEQPEPSPWAQSPSPSPAARADPAESPFFNNTATIDENAFQQNPPPQDYGAMANQSLGAIGADTSKTLIHIPLIQLVPSRGLLAQSLRFPIAILSILSPINPYPRNLRESLVHLLPHLASSCSLAQQYSQVQDRLRGQGTGHRSAALGLGGTFSDEGSELELVAELSEQIATEKGKDRAPTNQSSTNSPTSTRDSRPGSVAGTPFLEHLGFVSGNAATPGKSGMEMIDSYFSVKRQKGGPGQKPTTPGAQRPVEESPDKGKRPEKKAQFPRSVSRKGPTPSVRISDEAKSPAPPRSASLASESDYGDISQLERSDTGFRRSSQFTDSISGERPLPELISQLMLNSVPLQLFLAKPRSGDLVWTNRKFDAFRSQGEERVRDPWKNVHVTDRTGLVQGWNEALRSGSQFTHYVRVKRFNSDSDYRWFIFRASTLLASNGRLLYWIGSFLDVHEQYMKTLEASERDATVARDAKLRALADSIPQILFEAVEGEGIVSVNQQWHAYSGQTLEDARGLGFARQVHREDLQKIGVISPLDVPTQKRAEGTTQSQTSSSDSSSRTVEPTSALLARTSTWATPDSGALSKLLEKGMISVEKDENNRLFYSTEIRIQSRGGEFRWFLIRLVKVESELINHGRTSWYGTCTDIEARKALERELSEANRKVHQEMESKTKFFANMSHEIRTPLNGILGSMPWLVESSLDHDQRRTVDTIQNSSNNLRELVDNILDVTKVEAGKMNLVYKWFHVRTLLEEIIDTISSRAIERGLELNYTVDANVPSSVRGDPFRVRQVLLNLMGNSVKFTEQGEVYTRCSLHTPPTSDTTEAGTAYIAFDVVDTGRGFNPTEFKRIFQQFGQIDSGSSHDAGSGLGLFLSKQLVEMHGGQLMADSTVGEGSTFSFYIRVGMAPPGALASSPPPSRPTSYRQSASFTGGSPRSRSDSKTPTMSMADRRTPQSPAVASRLVASPDVQSPAQVSSTSSDPSIRSQSLNLVQQSSASSLLPTPESITSAMASASANERQALAEKAMAAVPEFKRSKSDHDGRGLAPDKVHPTTYSIIVICPAEYARAAIKQHIEQVVPHQVAVNVTTLADIGAFLDLVHGPSSPAFTHIVLDLPASSDVMLFLRQMANFTATVLPDVIVITDHYQKRDIIDDFNALTAMGRRGYMIHKPVKPAVFASIFDAALSRNLSKDAARSMAQTVSDDFKNTAERVKATIGNKSFRILLVEDSDTNRKVIQRYLTKVDLVSEEARDGEECTDMVLARPHDHYSLIICDIQMPKKNGYQVCKELRAWEQANQQPPIPIMALTANAMPEERAAAATAGFTDYLTKPVNFNTLGTMMIALLDPKAPHMFLKDRPPES